MIQANDSLTTGKRHLLTLKMTLPAAFALALSACSSLSGFGGGSSMSCPLPDGAHCDSVSNTYLQASRGTLPGQRRAADARKNIDGGQSDSTASSGEGSSYTNAKTSAHDGNVAVVRVDTAQAGLPLRSQPRVMRLWIKPWEDNDGDLHDQTYVYVPIDNGRWMVEQKQREVREAYAPGKRTQTSAPPVVMQKRPEAAPQAVSAPAVDPVTPKRLMVDSPAEVSADKTVGGASGNQ